MTDIWIDIFQEFTHSQSRLMGHQQQQMGTVGYIGLFGTIALNEENIILYGFEPSIETVQSCQVFTLQRDIRGCLKIDYLET